MAVPLGLKQPMSSLPVKAGTKRPPSAGAAGKGHKKLRATVKRHERQKR
jgi:hypothetical protein